MALHVRYMTYMRPRFTGCLYLEHCPHHARSTFKCRGTGNAGSHPALIGVTGMDEHHYQHGHDHKSREQNEVGITTVRFDLDGFHRIANIEINGVKHTVVPHDASQEIPQGVLTGNPAISAPIHDSFSAQTLGKKLLFAQTRNGIITIAMLLVFEVLAEALWFQRDPNLLEKFGWWIFYLDVSVVSLVVMIGYLRSYRYASTNHMISMMIGMTVGMQVGMMTGGVIGATDGYFMGALVGVGLGTLLGVGTAWCCGPMAITQALMSAVMGGTMGSMIVAMMPPEKLLIFMPVFTLLNIAILIWFSFLFFKDCVIGERCMLGRVVPFWMTLLVSLLTVSGLGGLMLLNPGHAKHFKSPEEDRASIDRNPFRAKELQKTQEKMPDSKEMSCGAEMSGGSNKSN